jgi:hypothetical protein
MPGTVGVNKLAIPPHTASPPAMSSVFELHTCTARFHLL